MKPSIILSIFLALSTSVFAQEITILEQSLSFISSEKQTEFYCISKDLDVSIGTQVANVNLQIQREGKNNSLAPAFYALWERANDMGANAFYVAQTNYSEEDKLYDIVVELWFLDNNGIAKNRYLYPRQIIVVFGDINTKIEKVGRNFKINKEKSAIMPYHFFVYQNTNVMEVLEENIP